MKTMIEDHVQGPQYKDPAFTNRILEAAALAFSEKGVKMKMEDVAKALAISKKTIYTIFPDKESLLSAMIENGFMRIKERERAILSDQHLTTLEKIREVIIALPESMQHMDFKQFHEVSTKYPKLFKIIEAHIESEWEPTLGLLEQGIAEGVIRPINPVVLKLMVEASIEHFLDSRVLESSGISYVKALEEMMAILLEGIGVR